MLAVVDNCADVCNFNAGKYLPCQPISKGLAPVSALWSQQVGCLPASRGKPSRSHFGAYAQKTNNKIQEKVMKSFIKSMMLIVAMLAMVGAVYAAFPDDLNPSHGDYWFSGSTYSKITWTLNWKVYDSTIQDPDKRWVNASTPLANMSSQAQPFTGNVYLSSTVIFNDDFWLAGNVISDPGKPNRNIRLTADGGHTFNLTNSGTVTVHSVLVEDNATFINRGTVNLPYTDAASEFYVEHGLGDQTGGHLDNYGTINVNGRFRFGYESSISSYEGGVIQGPGFMETEADGDTAGDYRLSIANAGGFDAAFQLASYNTAPINYTFNGATDQVTGVNMPQPVYRLTVDSGHTLTLSKDITLRSVNNPYNERPDFTVRSGSTLATGPYSIVSDRASGGGDKFILESGATIIVGHEEGISSYPTGTTRISSGAVQTTQATYSSGANYHYDGDNHRPDPDPEPGTVQFSGCFFTDNSAGQHRVHDLIIHNDRGLNLCQNFRPLDITGSVSPSANTDSTSTWGYVRGGTTLPVTLSYFNAVFNGFDSVTLQWETQTETNNLGFYILRSVEPDAAQANIVSELIPAANSSQGASYYFEDKSLYDDGLYYYWLQDVSFAGAVELHGPAMAQVSLNAGGNHSPDIPLKTGFTRCFPNPFNPSTQLEYYLENSSDVSFEVYNLKGQLVDQFSLRNQSSGFNRYTWEPQLSSGVYLIRFAAGGKSNTRRVVLTK